MTDYRATLSVSAAGEGTSKLTWSSSSFKAAAGTEPAKASEIIGGIYQAGLDNLAKPAGVCEAERPASDLGDGVGIRRLCIGRKGYCLVRGGVNKLPSQAALTG